MASTDFLLTGSLEWKHPVNKVVLEVIKDDNKLTAQQDYRDYYVTELDLLRKGVSPQTWQSESLTIKTSDQLSQILKILAENSHLPKPDVRTLLMTHFPDATVVGLNCSLNLAARLWLMLNIQDRKFETLRRQATCIDWDDKNSLQSCVRSLFPPPQWEVNASMSRLSPHFKASFLFRVCGLRIEWTTSIHDHLRLDRHKNLLRVFPYKHHLLNLLSSNNSPFRCPIHPDLIRETLKTLDLLFPVWDSDTVQLITKEKQRFHETPPFASSVAAVSLMDFHYWRDRLLELREVLDAPPVSWAQLWRDRRNPQQFWTFWIALVILILTCFSFVASIIQAWASVRALNLAIKFAPTASM